MPGRSAQELHYKSSKMDPLALITLQGTCKTAEQCDLFDKLFGASFPGDPDG